jgi:shikimate kinase
MCCGKTTIAWLLSEKLNLPHCALDDVCGAYYMENGFDPQRNSAIWDREGLLGAYRYWKPFEAYAVERILAEHPGSVISLGAGHSHYEDESLFARVQAALAPFPWVILLLPSPDLDESVEILNKRVAERPYESLPDWLCLNERFIRHPSNQHLAKIVIYTQNRTPEETCAEIIRHTTGGSSRN